MVLQKYILEILLILQLHLDNLHLCDAYMKGICYLTTFLNQTWAVIINFLLLFQMIYLD